MTMFRKILRSNGFALRSCVRGVQSGSHMCSPPLPPTIVDSTLSPFGEPLQYTPTLAPRHLDCPATSLSQPREHTEDQLSLWYTIPPEEFQTYFSPHYVLSLQYNQLKETFNTADLMIRKPSLCVINYIKQLKLETMTPPKFLFYGRHGAGKTCCLAHVSHYLAKEEFVLLQVPWVTRWMKQFVKFPAEVVQSISVPGRYDHTTDGSAWLKLFRSQNQELLDKLQLTTSRDYQLSTRELCPAGSSLASLVDMGINRARFSSDCVLGLTYELRQLASAARCKVAVVMDGINGMFTEDSIYRREEDRSIIQANCFTLVQAFTDMLRNDWSNGIVVGTLDANARPKDQRDDYMPRALLLEKGWSALDPFVAVPVPEYSETEFESAVSYYGSKRWVQKEVALTPQGRQHLSLVTSKNPATLVRTLAGL